MQIASPSYRQGFSNDEDDNARTMRISIIEFPTTARRPSLARVVHDRAICCGRETARIREKLFSEDQRVTPGRRT